MRLKYLILILFIIILTISLSIKKSPEIILPDNSIDEIVYYAKLKRISTSGDARFYWYDVDKKEIIDPDNQYTWFFALPTNVPNDSKATDDWIKYIKDNEDSIFKIRGTKKEDDCDYYGQGHCVQSININEIEVIN